MSQLLAWVCLVLVASTSAYGLQLTAAVLVPPAAAAGQVTSAPAAAGQVTSTKFTRRVLVFAVDPVTGDRAQVECDAPSTSFVSDVLIVDANDFPAVAQVCNVADMRAGRP